jgi:hypothetical protein
VHLELHLDAEGRSLLDCKRLVLERLEGAGRGQLNHHVGAALDLQGEGLNDAFSGVLGVADRVAGVEAQGGFPAVQGFVIFVCPCEYISIQLVDRGELAVRG